MSFGYIPDHQGKSPLKDLYLRIFGYPYPPRRNEAAIVFKFLNPKKNEKILDIGCGDGVWYNQLRKRGIQVTGLDTSSYDLNKLKERAKSFDIESKIIEADAQNMPFEQNTFDKTYSISTFEHIKDDKKVFREVARVLKPQGLLVISIPVKELPLLTKIAVNLPQSIKKLFYNKMVREAKTEADYLRNFNQHYFHYRNYTAEAIEERLRASGFKIENKSYNCRFFGSCIWSMYHTLKIFERYKSPTSGYKFKNEAAFALVAPFFYLLFLIDRLLPWKKGQIIILKLRKV